MRRNWEEEAPNLAKIIKNQGAEAAQDYYKISRGYLLEICRKQGIYVEKKTLGEYHYVGNCGIPDLPKWLIKRRNEIMLSMPFGAA